MNLFFRITWNPPTGEGMVNVGNVTTFTVANLIPFTDYIFTIAAINMAGIGPAVSLPDTIQTAQAG